MTEPVWITGVGVGTPHGWSFDAVADGLLAGRSAIDRVTTFDVSQHPSQIGAALGPIPRAAGIPDVFAEWTRLEQLGGWTVVAALRDSGLWDHRDRLRIGLVFSTGAEFAWSWENDAHGRPAGVYCDPAHDRRPLVPLLAKTIHLSGPTATVSTACSSGNYALSLARRWIQLGWCDVCLAGACEVGLTPVVLAGFGNLRALSRRNDNPTRACRPFDRDRDGFVLGEGGAVLVLEAASSARRRGAQVYGELAGVGLSNDAHHPVIPCPDPAQAVVAVRNALTVARVAPDDVHYVNAHGTSTPVGDVAEARGLREVFGRGYRKVPVSSTKSMTGHLLTAAAAVEAVACLATFRCRAIPPTINLDDPDPECELCHVPHTAREGDVRVAVSNSFGFGGSNSCAVFRAV
ncbi:MAG TPA: beta-ketoacyl-[acyl-carrier-protein] synthase family protein [Gemmataceae bacterium]|nr:beta-ketoacyl-[acyl-carrier-protein] synthase family protein [Gemmataceae bacterium]